MEMFIQDEGVHSLQYTCSRYLYSQMALQNQSSRNHAGKVLWEEKPCKLQILLVLTVVK